MTIEHKEFDSIEEIRHLSDEEMQKTGSDVGWAWKNIFLCRRLVGGKNQEPYGCKNGTRTLNSFTY